LLLCASTGDAEAALLVRNPVIIGWVYQRGGAG